MPKGFDWLWFCLHGTLLPAGGEGGRRKRKEPHDGKKSSHTDYTETHADFCVHAALGRLRFVSGSTAQLLYLVVFSISGTGVRVKVPNEKSVRVRARFSERRAQDWDLREQQAQQVYVHLQKNGTCHTGVTCCLASTSGVATHRKNGAPGCLPKRHFSFLGIPQTLSSSLYKIFLDIPAAVLILFG